MGSCQGLVGGGLLSGVSGRRALNCQELVRGGLLSGVSGRWALVKG